MADRRPTTKRTSEEREEQSTCGSTSRFLRDKRPGPKAADSEYKNTKYLGSEKPTATLAHGAARRSANHMRANRGDDVKKARKQVSKQVGKGNSTL